MLCPPPSASLDRCPVLTVPFPLRTFTSPYRFPTLRAMISDAIAQQGHREGRLVQATFKDLVPLAQRTDVANPEMERPGEDEVAKTAERTQAALQKLLNGKIKAANPKNVPSQQAGTSYIRYTPAAGGANGGDGSKQRIIKMVDVIEDPLEPPRFKAKKIPRGPPSPPAPILRSPPRKVTAQDQKDWMIPPCVSNWKNHKGYTIALDKRLAADGRGLQDVSPSYRLTACWRQQTFLLD